MEGARWINEGRERDKIEMEGEGGRRRKRRRRELDKHGGRKFEVWKNRIRLKILFV